MAGSTNHFCKQAILSIQALQGVNQNDVTRAVGGRSRRTAAQLGQGNAASPAIGTRANNTVTLATLGGQRHGVDWDMAAALGRADGKA